MNYEEKYNKALSKAKHALDCDRNNLVSTDVSLIYSMFPELKESEDERARKAIIRILKGETGYTSKEDTDKYVAWLEKQDKKTLDADKVIAWIRKCWPFSWGNFSFPVDEAIELFKKDFRL